MKASIFSALALLISLNANAEVKKSAPAVDCSKAAQGKVTIKTIGDRIAFKRAGSLAYQCFSQKNAKLIAARVAAIKKAQTDNDEPTKCGQSDPLQSLVLTSWTSERPSISVSPEGKTVATTGGGTYLLMREPITCGSLGTGLFGGIVGAVSAQLDIEESYIFNMDDESDPGLQLIQVKFETLLQI